MATLGVDHGTRAIRFYLSPSDEFFEIDRKKALKASILKEMEKRIPLGDIELVGLTYSMGDGIDKITDIRRVKNRGVLAERTGEYVGGGTKVYDEIASSGLRTVVIPGLHRGIKALDKRFRALYSHCASAEKVSLSYHAHLETKANDLVVCDVGSNTVTIGVKEGRFFGAIDACLGAMGLQHGPLDLDAIRRIDRGETAANRAFYSAGATKIYPTEDPMEILEPKNESARLALDSLVLSVAMEIAGFAALINPEGIVITGEFGAHENVFSGLKKMLGDFGKVVRIDGSAAAKGSSEIARDVLRGKKDFLGIGVDFEV